MVQKRKRKKAVKMRGSHTHGYGSKKRHRGSGGRGGKGYAGSFGHNKVKYMLQEPEHYEKRRFKSLREKQIVPTPVAISLRDVEKLAAGKKEINLTELGYDRVLSSGKLTKPLTITAKYFTAKAKTKIEKVGGKAIQEAEESG